MEMVMMMMMMMMMMIVMMMILMPKVKPEDLEGATIDWDIVQVFLFRLFSLLLIFHQQNYYYY